MCCNVHKFHEKNRKNIWVSWKGKRKKILTYSIQTWLSEFNSTSPSYLKNSHGLQAITSLHPVHGNERKPTYQPLWEVRPYILRTRVRCDLNNTTRAARRERIDLTPLRAFKARELRTHFAPIITALESVKKFLNNSVE